MARSMTKKFTKVTKLNTIFLYEVVCALPLKLGIYFFESL